MSVRTPILTTSSETWASAAGDANIAAASAPSMDIFLAEITGILPSPFGALAGLLDRELKLSRFTFLQLFCSRGQTSGTGQAANRI
jgi:hypothetical protein